MPAGTQELNTQGLPLIIHSVASDTTPVAISHADMGHDHPPASFDVWRLQPMGGSWTITGRAQPGRSCRGVTGGADEPDPVTLTVVGSCSGELGTGPQSIIPPEPVSPSDAGSSLLKCNGDIAGSGSRIVHLWIQQPTGCVVQGLPIFRSPAGVRAAVLRLWPLTGAMHSPVPNRSVPVPAVLLRRAIAVPDAWC